MLYLLLWLVLLPAWAGAGIDPNLTYYLIDGHPLQAAHLTYAISLTQTIIFTNLVICEIIFVYACTSNIKPFYEFPNKYLFWATGLSLGLQLLILFTPIGGLFNVVALLRWEYWLAFFLGAFSVFVIDELRKYRLRIRQRKN